MSTNEPTPQRAEKRRKVKGEAPPELYNIVIECRDERQQRELYERLRGEGVRVRLLVL
jgi:hypothetical protein